MAFNKDNSFNLINFLTNRISAFCLSKNMLFLFPNFLGFVICQKLHPNCNLNKILNKQNKTYLFCIFNVSQSIRTKLKFHIRACIS